MKPFLPNKQKSSNNIPSVRVNGDLIQDIKQIVNEFNRYFVSVGTSIQQEVDQPKENAFEDYLSFNDNARFNFSDVTETEVLYELQSLSEKKATGPDEIPASFLRMAAPYIAKSVCHIVNLSLQTGDVPEQ